MKFNFFDKKCSVSYVTFFGSYVFKLIILSESTAAAAAAAPLPIMIRPDGIMYFYTPLYNTTPGSTDGTNWITKLQPSKSIITT